MWETQWCFHIQSQSQSWLATFQTLSSFVHLVTTVLTRQFHAIFQRSLRVWRPSCPQKQSSYWYTRSRLPSLPWMTSLLSPTLPTHKSSAKWTIYTQMRASESASGEHLRVKSSKGSHISYFLSYSQFLPFLLLSLHGVNPYWKFQQGVFYAVTTSGKGLFIFEPEYQRTEECPLPWGQSGVGSSNTHGDSCAQWSSNFPGPPEAAWLRDQGAKAEEHEGPTYSPTRWLWEPSDRPEDTFCCQTKGGGTDTINLYLKGNLNLCRHWW